MRTQAACLMLILLISSCTPSRVGMSATYYGESSGYYVAVADYYGVPERDVIVLRERRISEEEIPVVLFICQRAHVQPAAVIDLRSQGQSWMDISLHFGLGPDVYYVPTTVVTGTPYSEAYSYYQSRPRPEWKSIRLSDDDVVNFVNLRVMSEHYGSGPPEVMKMRSEGKSFSRINEEIRARKGNRGKGRDKH